MLHFPTTPFIISKKIFLICLGLFFLYAVSNTIYSLYLITSITILTYILANYKCSLNDVFKIKIFEKYSVPLAFLIILSFNFFGFIGTLTGSVSDNSNLSLLFVGLTFYLLSAGAYLTDIKKNNYQNSIDEFVNLFLYLILPFKLLAGPLENTQIIKQFNYITLKIKSFHKFFYCFSWIALGLFMKFCISSRLRPDQLLIFTDPISSFFCALIFELKFYFDFAGYSFLVFGLAKLINLKLTLNFNHPFTAKNVVEFWHRWHITLGKFLQKYILLKNLDLFKSRFSKAIFASTIFLISALWHGGTVNYFFWGMFHALVYLFYIQKFKHLNIPKTIGYFFMFLFFVFGRMIAIDINSGRILEKFINYFNLSFYMDFKLEKFIEIYNLAFTNKYTFPIIVIFIFFEFLQIKKLKKKNYHLFRKPLVSLVLFLLFIFFGFNSLELLYARI